MMTADLGGELRSQQWLFDSRKISSPNGVLFGVRYVGQIPVRVSMRSLDFERRKELSRFCISVLAELSGLRPGRRTDERNRPLMSMVTREEARVLCADAHLAISTTSLRLILSADGENGEKHGNSGRYQMAHDLSCVSFAAGGEGDTLDFVAYVANDPAAGGRSCHVLECPGGQANQIVVTIGQAFEVRRTAHVPANFEWNEPARTNLSSSFNGNSQSVFPSQRVSKSQSQSAVLPPRAIPDGEWPSMPPIPQLPPPMNSLHSNFGAPQSRAEGDALVSLDSELQPSAFVNSAFSNDLMSASFTSSTSSNAALARTATEDGRATRSTDPNEPPTYCGWYHGVLSRTEAERLVQTDGEFLVRASASAVGQYVLSGRYAGLPKHLLLVDPSGHVRTSDRDFESVQHLIDYHVRNRVPIVSHDSQLLLTTPILRAPRTASD